ncbi:DeoR/GlpR family DNA-binding transcription regulator [Spiroplasma floricola]|uniref:DeoR family transcriptional regulator n=1 Tax=Spiroplasma floricola 23-6 TaxID=1336749 RepID=A0A2K8SEN3_9MOLU|nr:DeoR/GlpR family DNA-binding transcription regulator [Spiroplasma floricola]AUB31718.1 DeoR family transcriptional regulator [Spiroplasma floricola 23-6]
MLKDERRELIVELLNKNGFMKNITLSELTNSTIQTIIMDINELQLEGRLIKVYGGARSISNNQQTIREYFDEEKESLNIEAKNQIASFASTLIEENDLIFIDTGTTTKKMINYLIGKNIQVVTNGYSIALELLENDISVCLVGGTIIPTTHATAGELALKFLDNFNFDKAFLGMNNLYKNDFYTTNIEEAMIKEKVIKNSLRSYILMDSSKFNSKNKIKVDVEKETYLISENLPLSYEKKYIFNK